MLREQVRNQLLRRADWRFLLPNPQPDRSICFAHGQLAKAVALVSNEVLDARCECHEDCDLAVAVNPNHATLRSAWQALRPGGACYTEWWWPSMTGVRGVRRRLAAAGFVNVSCYWAWPLHVPAQFWLPLEAPDALHYFLSTRAPASSARQQVGNAVQKLAWQWLMRGQLLFPIRAVATKPERTPRHAAAGVPVCETETASQAAFSNNAICLLRTGGQRSVNKVVKFVFAGTAQQPQFVVKIARVPEVISWLKDEAAVLRYLHAQKPQGIPGVPRVLFYREEPKFAMLGETVVAGAPLWSVLRRGNYRDLALKATDWLAALAADGPRQPPESWWERLVQPALNKFEQEYGSIADRTLIQQTRAKLECLGPLPVVCEHRDFAPWNLLLTREGQLAVLDWESCELRGLPALDLTYFLTKLTFTLEQVKFFGEVDVQQVRNSYRAAMNSATFTGRVHHECYERYAERVGLEPDTLHTLRLLTWLVHAGWEYDAFVADVAGEPAPETLRRSRYFNLWVEELQACTG